MQLPLSVDLASLTVENFQSVTGHRFRMTKEQKARAITREAALAEFVVAQTAARAATNTPAPTSAPTNS
jgi:hypothetical protein